MKLNGAQHGHLSSPFSGAEGVLSSACCCWVVNTNDCLLYFKRLVCTSHPVGSRAKYNQAASVTWVAFKVANLCVGPGILPELQLLPRVQRSAFSERTAVWRVGFWHHNLLRSSPPPRLCLPQAPPLNLQDLPSGELAPLIPQGLTH